MIPIPVRDVLLDIEGTTSSISFVHRVLFPYARTHLPAFIQEHHGDPAVQRALAAAQASLRVDGWPCDSLSDQIGGLLRYIDEDRKDTGLKTLQGMLWRVGYERQDYQGHMYSDVLPTLKRWRSYGLRVSIYSSGSVEAQKLIFGYSESGDLTSYIHSYFDTRVGHKREVGSYRAIAFALARESSEILFLSDTQEELSAAAEAGFYTLQVVRDASTDELGPPMLGAPGASPAPMVTSIAQAAELLRV
ncbi:MAG: acireductone synthase [Myxococcales bacterium]|nr:acireductone synthase [Myxococcales bacterium]